MGEVPYDGVGEVTCSKVEEHRTAEWKSTVSQSGGSTVRRSGGSNVRQSGRVTGVLFLLEKLTVVLKVKKLQEKGESSIRIGRDATATPLRRYIVAIG